MSGYFWRNVWRNLFSGKGGVELVLADGEETVEAPNVGIASVDIWDENGIGSRWKVTALANYHFILGQTPVSLFLESGYQYQDIDFGDITTVDGSHGDIDWE